jgi:hypothetical protein
LLLLADLGVLGSPGGDDNASMKKSFSPGLQQINNGGYGKGKESGTGPSGESQPDQNRKR